MGVLCSHLQKLMMRTKYVSQVLARLELRVHCGPVMGRFRMRSKLNIPFGPTNFIEAYRILIVPRKNLYIAHERDILLVTGLTFFVLVFRHTCYNMISGKWSTTKENGINQEQKKERVDVMIGSTNFF